MACDQHDLADAAKNLTDEYASLHFAKSRQVIREARVTAPKPGPQAPSPTHLLSLQVELEERLLEMACEVRDHVRPGYLLGTDGRSLCTFIRQQAGPASRMDVAGDLLAEMQDQANEIASVLGNLPGKEPGNNQRHLLNRIVNNDELRDQSVRASAAEVAGMVERITGAKVDRKLITQWAARGHIPTHEDARGEKTYGVADVIKYMQGKSGQAHDLWL